MFFDLHTQPPQIVRAEAERGLDLGHHLAVQVRLLGHRHARQLGADRLARPEARERRRPVFPLEPQVALHEGRVGLGLELRCTLKSGFELVLSNLSSAVDAPLDPHAISPPPTHSSSSWKLEA